MSDKAIVWLIAICSVVTLAVAIPVISRAKSEARVTTYPSPAIPKPSPVPSERAAVVPVNQSPSRPSQPGFFTRTSSVGGAIWLTRNDGASSLMRGLKVCVISNAASKKAFQADLKVEGKFLADEAKDFQDEVKQHAEIFGGIDPEVQKIFLDRTNLLLAKSQTLKTAFDSAPPQIDMLVAYSELLGSTTTGIVQFSNILAEAELQSTETDVDGRYSFTKLVDGKYYIYARFSSDTMRVVWLTALQVNGGNVKLDLHNGNAIAIKNFKTFVDF